MSLCDFSNVEITNYYRCMACDPSGGNLENAAEVKQRRIWNVARTQSSLYTMNLASANNTINRTNVGLKHDSYNRYLNNKKNGYLKTKKTSPLPTPKQGNKQYLLGFIRGCSC